MPTGKLRIVLLWHMHQPFYKDLATGEYRLPWVRMHALKDYYGMVKLLEEFPGVHQNFNLVPSLVRQIKDYAAGTARDPFLNVAAKPAAELSSGERRFALQYLFQANVERMISRYPRYRELLGAVQGAGRDPARAEASFSTQDFADLQVLSQLAWFDEFYLQEPDVRELVRKGRNFSRDDQRLVMKKQAEIIRAVLPAYKEAAQAGRAELSATPFYHPILPLLCDTDIGAESSPGLQLPSVRFRHPEDAELQIQLALAAHQDEFGARPRGLWPSEGGISEEVLAIAARNGIAWMASDEAVLGRTLDFDFHRDSQGRISAEGAAKLYTIYHYQKDDAAMHLLFRDHRISDLIGFVYGGMPAAEAATHLVNTLRQAAEPVLSRGNDAVITIILDGENAWETYHESGREFLRRFYALLLKDPQMEAVTVSEAIERHPPKQFGQLSRLVPGSWINANFNVWIGAKEDNLAWDYLSEAHDHYDANAHKASEEMRQLAFEELLIAEGSDWNWWYGPEHHSANDRDFDELYRKHLSNVYNALGGLPPDDLARPITRSGLRPRIVPQTAYIHPRVDGYDTLYFDWIGAAMYAADARTSAMHGRQFFLESAHAGIDETSLYGRLDFIDRLPEGEFRLVADCAAQLAGNGRILRLEAAIANGALRSWTLFEEASGKAGAAGGNQKEAVLAVPENPAGVEAALATIFEFKLPLALL
ncbi:MAG: glycoside hydrolase family 57 protein, partial [Candidatus Korobacteraceae bacterium]